MRVVRLLIPALLAFALVAATTRGGAAADVAATTTELSPPAHPAQISPAPWATLLTAPFPDPAVTPAVIRQQRLRAALADAARRGADLLVDKRRGLPAGYRPRDLVLPRVTFLGGVPDERRRLRRPAARALERLFAAARRDGVPLAGVSAFRSYSSQRELFAGYASERGVENASHVSARAGHSEHQTGLAIDVSGADGRCAASRCFGTTRAARWLAAHAAEQGFVIRYPRGRERVTGYAYEPWHLRWVGAALAREIVGGGRTLDQLLGVGSPARRAIPR